MSMPLHLMIVRHGRSEQNEAKDAAEHGDPSHYTPEFIARNSLKVRLTDEGREQAIAAGEWLRANGFSHFDRYEVSEAVRAKETAALLGLPEALWRKELYLREMEYGKYDAYLPDDNDPRYVATMQVRRERDGYLWRPTNGESLAGLSESRLGRWTDMLHRECGDMRVIAVCHGGVMRALRVRYERMSLQDYDAWEAAEDKDPSERIANCQILHYTRQDPETGLVRPSFGWVRSICPWDEKRSWPGWRKIVRRKYTNEELLAEVQAQPRLVNV